MVSFVSCEKADEHVGGALASSAALVTADTERACYVEILEGESIRYAGALIVPKGSDVKSVTILDLIHDGGIAVTVSAGVQKTEALAGSDVDAPGGGYAEFALGSSDPGRVVRLESDRTQAMYEFSLADGTIVRAEVTSNGTPKDVVAMAQTVFEGSRGG